jgi:putative transposase
MRKENFTIGSFVHVYNRGNRKQPIVRDQKDKWHFLENLFYFNNKIAINNPSRSVERRSKLTFDRLFDWPAEWPERDPLVKIIAFCLMENHFHLLLKEIQEEGISLFMKKIGTGMASYFNKKYNEVGTLFQGSYKAKRVDEDLYLNYLSVYIQVKNPFENYPGGFQEAIKNFDKAYGIATKDPYCSLADYAGLRNSPIINEDILEDFFPNPESYKEFARQCLVEEKLEDKLGKLTLE